LEKTPISDLCAENPNRLGVTAYLDRKQYPTGLKPNPRLISSLRLKHSNTLPKWNYTIAPNL
jgi:hypothetical protein